MANTPIKSTLHCCLLHAKKMLLLHLIASESICSLCCRMAMLRCRWDFSPCFLHRH
ncbi:uncharacterized protein DS421_5g160860 [Arachis hypogaea]|nr:uncharacterized protein DS421_5g160860 [Arachis hypogaea]